MAASRTQYADDGRKDGNHGNDDDDVVDILADVRDQASEGVAAEKHRGDPKNAAKNIEDQIARVGHLRSAGDGRAKCAHDRHEAREDDCAAAVFFIEIVSTLQMAAAKKEGVFALVERCARGAPNPVANLIADNRAENSRDQQPSKRNDSTIRQNPRSDEQRVAGEEEADKETSFNKYDGTDERGSAGADQFPKALGTEERVEKMSDRLEQATGVLALGWTATATGIKVRDRRRALKAPSPIR
jgi:hypothetical protein